MILGMEIAMLVIGFLALVRGKMTISATKVVEGAPARVLGLIAMTPLPLAFAVAIAYVAASNPADPEQFAKDNQWTLTAIEAGIVIAVAVVVFGFGAAMGVDPAKADSRRRRLAEDDDSHDRYADDEQGRRPWER